MLRGRLNLAVVDCSAQEQVMATRRLYIGNFPYSTTEDHLRGLFEAHFKVMDARIITDRETGKSKGFGFVELATEKMAQDAIEELDGTDFMGRTLRVREANARPTGKRERGKGRDYGW